VLSEISRSRQVICDRLCAVGLWSVTDPYTDWTNWCNV